MTMTRHISKKQGLALHCSVQNSTPFRKTKIHGDKNSGVMMLLALLFVSTAVASPLLGTEQCARGPPYWCQNVKTASICGAVYHCKQNVWKQPQMKSVPCDLCKQVLTVVEQLLKDNATQSEILGYLEKACQLIPDQGLTAECKEMVDSYYPIIIGIITGELDDPSVACAAMGLCHSEQAALAHAQEQLLSNEIPQLDLAQKMPPFIMNIPQLLYPQETPKEKTPVLEAGDLCQDCVKFLTDAQEEAKANASYINSLIERIEKQCDLLGPGMSDLCKQYVSQYAPVLVQQLMSMQPKDICARAGFCEAVTKSSPMLNLQEAVIIPAVKLVPATQVDSVPSKPVKAVVRSRDSPQCAICEYVMKEVETILEDQTTEAEVIHAVENVCTLLPSSLSAQCKDLIEAYGQAIIELLVQQADPKTICTVLGLCKDASRAYISVMSQADFKAGGFCDVCKMAVRYIDGILEQNATEAQIEEAVRKVCSFLPESVRRECDQLVQQYEPMLVQLLLQMIDPDFVCMAVAHCKRHVWA